jgi:hypothetical protein
MRLSIRPRPGWSVHSRVSGDVVVTHERGDVRIEVTPIVGKSQLDALQFLAREAPPHRHMEILSAEDRETDDGWPMKQVTLRFVGLGGEAVETRVGAVYDIVCFAAAAIARGADGPGLAWARTEILAILSSARPHLWGDEPMTVAELGLLEDP